MWECLSDLRRELPITREELVPAEAEQRPGLFIVYEANGLLWSVREFIAAGKRYSSHPNG